MCLAIRRHRSPLFIVLSVLLALAASSPASSEEARPVAEMSLEELLGLRIDQMAITGIHHTHAKGEWMIGYHFMYMSMQGNRKGTKQLHNQDVFDMGYMVAPRSMSMEMHMLHAMYGVTDQLTTMFIVPYLRKEMEHVRMMDGARFATESRGLGDIQIKALYSVFESTTHDFLINGGLSFPSGSVSETDSLPGMLGPATIQRLPYPMQLGSGTWDFLLGGTYLGQTSDWGWGANVSGTVRVGDNKYDYRLGDQYDVTAWASRLITDWSSASLRLDWRQWFNIHGRDDSLNPAMVPTADPNLRAGRRLDLMFGANVFASEGTLEGTRLMFEAGLPVYQWLEGPQLETDWLLSLNLEWTF